MLRTKQEGRRDPDDGSNTSVHCGPATERKSTSARGSGRPRGGGIAALGCGTERTETAGDRCVFGCGHFVARCARGIAPVEAGVTGWADRSRPLPCARAGSDRGSGDGTALRFPPRLAVAPRSTRGRHHFARLAELSAGLTRADAGRVAWQDA